MSLLTTFERKLISGWLENVQKIPEEAPNEFSHQIWA